MQKAFDHIFNSSVLDKEMRRMVLFYQASPLPLTLSTVLSKLSKGFPTLLNKKAIKVSFTRDCEVH
jgi:hypothetical protein